MQISISLIARDGSYNATAVYQDGMITVKHGSRIRLGFADHVRGGKTAKNYRGDKSVVGDDGITLKDCAFKSPSTAAQFVMGTSVNGWTAWHVDKKTNLRQYVDAHK